MGYYKVRVVRNRLRWLGTGLVETLGGGARGIARHWDWSQNAASLRRHVQPCGDTVVCPQGGVALALNQPLTISQ